MELNAKKLRFRERVGYKFFRNSNQRTIKLSAALPVLAARGQRVSSRGGLKWLGDESIGTCPRRDAPRGHETLFRGRRSRPETKAPSPPASRVLSGGYHHSKLLDNFLADLPAHGGAQSDVRLHQFGDRSEP
jgi:hypothetical protein